RNFTILGCCMLRPSQFAVRRTELRILWVSSAASSSRSDRLAFQGLQLLLQVADDSVLTPDIRRALFRVARLLFQLGLQRPDHGISNAHRFGASLRPSGLLRQR